MILRTPARRGAALALAASAALALSACGSSESASNTASNAVSAAGTAASKAGDAVSSAATNATSAVAGAASDASTAASSGASSAGSAASAGTTEYTLADVQKHATATDCWAAIKAPGETTTGVYNLTDWISNHPGGPEAIKGLCGTDATQKFLGKHGDDGAQGAPEKRLATFKVGELKG